MVNKAMEQDTPSQRYTIIQETPIRSCELRLERQIEDAGGQERWEYVCGASGGPEQGHVLGVSGEDLARMAAICNACPIPDVLESRRSCLQLVPVRRFPTGQRVVPVIQASQQSDADEQAAEAYFPCRWFYTLYGRDQPRDGAFCLGCPYWFPRPPRELIPGYWPETQKMLRIVNGEEDISKPPTGFMPAAQRPPDKPETWWQRLREKLHL